MNSSRARYAVIGHPIEHSLSPILYRAAFEAAGMDASFEAVDALDGEAAVQQLRARGYAGLAVTIPHKIAALRCAERVHEDAERVGAANTLVFGPDIFAYNTDVDGVRYAFSSSDVDLRKRSVVLLGAGGAARAALWACLVEGASAVAVVARNAESTRALADAFRGGHTAVDVADPARDNLSALLGRYDVLINTTPVGMDGASTPIPEAALRAGLTVLDAVYRPARTPLLRAVLAAGGHAIPGTRWFLGQAAAQFQRLTGMDAPEDAMADAIRRVPECDWL